MYKCNLCGAVLDIEPHLGDDAEEIMWGHIQMEHEAVYDECQCWESPWMIEEYFTVTKEG